MDNRRELEALDPSSNNATYTRVDALTPHKIAIVILIQQYLKAKQKAQDSGTSYPAQSRRKFCMVLLKLIQLPDMSYKDLYSTLTSSKYRIDTAHLVDFENCMSNLVSSNIGCLFDLFDMQSAMDKILSENSGVSQYGVVGLYIRRVAVTLDRMTFPEMMALHRSIILYYEKGFRSLGICPSGKSANSSLVDNHIVSKERNNHSKWSVKQAELFILQQSLLLESNQLQALPPMELQSRINEIIEDNPLLSQAHFLSYMNYLRLRDFFSALDVLHRTFDRNPVQTLNPTETRGFQYSSLNLAIFHTQLNHKTLAEKCLRECIMLSQQAGDKHCLEHANAWHCILHSDSIKPSEKTIPDDSDLAMTLPASLSIQFAVKLAAISGYKPHTIFEILLKSDDLNCRNTISELAISAVAERASIWSLYGKNEIGSLYSQLLLRLYQIWTPENGNNEAICQALCLLALWLGTQGEYALSAVILQNASIRFPRDPVARTWMTCDCYVTIAQAIHTGKWRDGNESCCQLSLLDENAGILQRASLFIARGNLVSAQKILDKILLKRNLEPLVYIRALILLAHSQISRTQISSQVVDTLNTALTHAKEKYLHHEVSVINMIFSHVLLQMGMARRAFDVMQTCLEPIYSNGSIYDKARASVLFARCTVAATEGKEKKVEKILDCMGMITEAIFFFKKLEAHSKVKDVYVFLATFYHSVGMRAERNRFAYKFRQYDQDFPTQTEYLSAFY
ncbi:anaphase-promoting complex subunit 5 [Hermetia illucens]|uniref:anaphase-promoting complex subunit 5 n=1 Tax=Hermetia illucens TaxID=343691 RepID=UPI0018CC23CE|nr:anaphase-promoting complex subunit 5 [Hermetia illucens]